MHRRRIQKLKSGDEFDVVTSWRKILCWCGRAGQTSKVKKRLNKRYRQEQKKTVSELVNE